MGNVLRGCTAGNIFQKRKSTKKGTGLNTRARESKHMPVIITKNRVDKADKDFHTYDEVTPDIPIYATVNKKKPADVHYAEIQVIQQGSRRTAKHNKVTQRENETQYATINFTPAVKYDRKNGTLV